MCPAFEMEQLIEGIQLLADNRSFFFLSSSQLMINDHLLPLEKASVS
jgi:hypothetical protein